MEKLHQNATKTDNSPWKKQLNRYTEKKPEIQFGDFENSNCEQALY